MTDWNAAPTPVPLFVNTDHFWCAPSPTTVATASNGSAAWPLASMIIYMPMTLPWPFPVRRVFWANGSSAAGNMAMGIYTAGGAKIYATASTAQSGASVKQYVSPATPFVLQPGNYYLALINDGTTNRVFGGTLAQTGDGRVRGMAQQQLGGGSMVLPNAMTAAQYAQTIVPFMGITRTTTGY